MKNITDKNNKKFNLFDRVRGITLTTKANGDYEHCKYIGGKKEAAF